MSERDRLAEELAPESAFYKGVKDPVWPKGFKAGWDARQTEVDEFEAECKRLRKALETYRGFVNQVGIETGHTKRYELMLMVTAMIDAVLEKDKP